MSITVRFEGLDEFMERMKLIADQYPQTAEKHLRRVGAKLKKKVEENTPVGKTADTYTKSDKKRKSKVKLKNSWTAKVIGFKGHSLEYQLRSKSRRYHLVERGHVQKTPKGRITGFTQGKFFFKKAVEDFKSSGEVRKQLEKFMQEIQRKAGG